MCSARILLVDDEPHTRSFICDGLSALGITDDAVGVSTADEAIAEIARYVPDLVITDVRMPGLSGLDAIRHIRAGQPQVRVIILSAHAGEDYALRALRQGAVGYVLKEQSATELIRAIREARPGHPFLSPSIADRLNVLLNMENGTATVPESVLSRRYVLTPREGQVLDLLIQGMTNRDIGRNLAISPRTVEVHRTNLMRKLGLKSRADLESFVRQQNTGDRSPGPQQDPTPED